MRPRLCTCVPIVGFGERLLGRNQARSILFAATFTIAAILFTPGISLADEGGVSFWLPGFFGSLAATPQQLGWSLATIYIHTDVSASGNAALSRQITIGQFNQTIDVNLNAHIKATGDLGVFAPTYVFATPFLGGQASATLAGIYGRTTADLNATLFVPAIPLTKSIDVSDATTGFGDLIPQFAVRWNAGVNNYMSYITGDIPVGKYDSSDLANIGIGHGALDGGVGYTYFDPKTGHEFSATFGLTGNFKNPSTGYTNGIDSHLDLGASQFLTKQFQLGLVGYFFRQLTPDSGGAAILGPFESQVAGIGPQVGYSFPVGHMLGYLNLKAYKEFAAEDRPSGWNAWVTFVLSPAPPQAEAPPPILRK